MIEILTKKWFWILVLGGGLTGLILALVIPTDYDKIKDSERMYVCKNDNRFENSAPGFRNINDSNDVNVYSELIANKSNLGPQSLSGVSYNKEVYVYERKKHLRLSYIIVKNEHPNKAEPAIYTFWISDSFLLKEPCEKNKTNANTK